MSPGRLQLLVGSRQQPAGLRQGGRAHGRSPARGNRDRPGVGRVRVTAGAGSRAISRACVMILRVLLLAGAGCCSTSPGPIRLSPPIILHRPGQASWWCRAGASDSLVLDCVWNGRRGNCQVVASNDRARQQGRCNSKGLGESRWKDGSWIAPSWIGERRGVSGQFPALGLWAVSKTESCKNHWQMNGLWKDGAWERGKRDLGGLWASARGRGALFVSVACVTQFQRPAPGCALRKNCAMPCCHKKTYRHLFTFHRLPGWPRTPVLGRRG